MSKRMKEIIHGKEARKRLLAGAETCARAVMATMGPGGRNVIIENEYTFPTVTRDGVTVAKEVKLHDRYEDMGASMVRQAASKTNDVAGDGPQPLHAKVLTPTGFIKMGEVKKGMSICGTNGTIQKVVEVYEKGEKGIYKVKFTDGREVECSEDHLWTVTDASNHGKKLTMTVREMVNKGVARKNPNNSVTHRFFVQGNSVEFLEKAGSLPIDPYLLGTLIGDGSLSGTGSIELSLGFKKRHIIDKLVLPEGTTINKQECEKYIRLKLKGTKLKKALEKLGLYGVKSSGKFIPEVYLRSSTETRKKLLLGLLDTDGYINSKGLFEFSTVSKRLSEDFKDLCWSLGYPLNVTLHKRDNDLDSYSNKPIFRITQLKGRKHGLTIESIRKTSKKAPMRCIKVSNEDNLYVTDGFIVTHNTSTSSCLTYYIAKQGMEDMDAGVNAVEYRKGIEAASDDVIEFVKSKSKKVESQEELNAIAVISANDDTIGEIVAKAMTEAGETGTVIVDDGFRDATEVERSSGLRIDRPIISPYFVNNKEDMKCLVNDTAVVLVREKIDSTDQFSQFLIASFDKAYNLNRRSLVIVADDFSDQVIGAFLNMNQSGNGLTILPVKTPEFGENSDEVMGDLAAFTGATSIGGKSGRSANSYSPQEAVTILGYSPSVTANRDFTIFTGGGAKELGREADLEKHIEGLKNEIDRDNSTYRKEKLKTRLGRIAGGVVHIRVGGLTETEMKERRMRYEDAVSAAKAATTGGYVVGGGMALMGAGNSLDSSSDMTSSFRKGYENVLHACEKPFLTIAENAGFDKKKVLPTARQASKVEGMGFDATVGKFVNLVNHGIIDPTDVVVSAVRNSVSGAVMLLTTEAAMKIIRLDRQEFLPE